MNSECGPERAAELPVLPVPAVVPIHQQKVVAIVNSNSDQCNMRHDTNRLKYCTLSYMATIECSLTVSDNYTASFSLNSIVTKQSSSYYSTVYSWEERKQYIQPLLTCMQEPFFVIRLIHSCLHGVIIIRPMIYTPYACAAILIAMTVHVLQLQQIYHNIQLSVYTTYQAILYTW